MFAVSLVSGLSSRFPTRYQFEPFNLTESWQVLKRVLDSKGFDLDPQCESTLSPLLHSLLVTPDWGNGRDLGVLADQVASAVSLAATLSLVSYDVLDDRTVVRMDLLQSVLNTALKQKQHVGQAHGSSSVMPLPRVAAVPSTAAAPSFSSATRVSSASPSAVTALVQQEEKERSEEHPQVSDFCRGVKLCWFSHVSILNMFLLFLGVASLLASSESCRWSRSWCER